MPVSITSTTHRQDRSRRGLRWSAIIAAAAVAATLAVLPTTQAYAAAGAVIDDAGCSQHVLPRNDDGSTGAINLPFTLNFFGQGYSTAFVNNNGNVTFDTPLGTYTPFGLGSTYVPIVAPFFADVDTRGGEGVTTYGTTTYEGHPAFCVTWPRVGYFANQVDKLNTFQLLLVSRTDRGNGDFDIVFNYDTIKWETGSARAGRAVSAATPRTPASPAAAARPTPPTSSPAPASTARCWTAVRTR